MRAYIVENLSGILDGLLFGLGVLAVYLGAVFTAALVRSLGGAGSAGITRAGRYAQGWLYYLRGDDRDIVNVTLNMLADGALKFDTLVADRKLWFVWPNAYRVGMIRAACRRTSADNPVLAFPAKREAPRSWFGRLCGSCADWVSARLASVEVTENGRSRRVRLLREDDYRAAYAPLISLVSEKCTNDGAIDLAIGRPMQEHRFVIALTYEKLHSRRARHLRAMVMWEPQLQNLPAECPAVEREEHRTRYRTLQEIARQYAAQPERFGVVRVWRARE